MASESLGKTVHRRAMSKSVWMNAVPKGSYPLGTGLTQTSFTIENSMPTNDTLDWEKITNSGTTSAGTELNMLTGDGLCERTWQDIEWGFSEQTYSPERISVRGPQICQSNLKYHFNTDTFLRAYVEEISKHSKRILENKLQNEYMKKARKVTLTGTTAGGAALDDTATSPSDELHGTVLQDTEVLLQEHLDQLAIKLIESGATEGDSSGWIELGPNGPVFPLIIGMEASHKLLQTAASSELRTDYREGAPNELLKALGADRVIGNFRHIVVTNPPRFKYNSGTTKYERVPEYVAKGSSDVAGGSGVELNSAYTSSDASNAPQEAAVVLVPSVMKQLVVPSSTPGNLGFTPENYSGDWKFITGAYKFEDCSDPTESFGRHIGTYEMAFEPVFGEHGATVIFDR